MLLFLVLLVSGCGDPREEYGRTWYIDGAGNWGFGVLDVPAGLQDANYAGAVSHYRWSLTMNPALDQTFRFIAKSSGASLGREITAYLKKYPKADANIIALSAGTGVGIWAVENVESPAKVNHFIMLGSSLSSRYDVSKALRNMKGNIYVYYTSTDPVLDGPVRALGTIDGTYDDSAGLVGLVGPSARSGRVVNIARRSEHSRFGWTGGHADCTNRRFVEHYLARHLVDGDKRESEASPPAPCVEATAGSAHAAGFSPVSAK